MAFAAEPKFEVVSIKRCQADNISGGRTGEIRPTSPGALHINCAPVRILIQRAYLQYANGQMRDFNFYDVPIERAPEWTQTERYTIEAKAAGSEDQGTMNGPMLRALLEDRFGLKVRRESRPADVFELVVAKGGHKLRPFDGSCIPDKTCRNTGGVSGPNITRYWRAITIDDLISSVLDKQFVGRPVVNRTGISGVFDIKLEFTPERNSNAPDAGPSIFKAVQDQLGLKLVPSRGLEEHLVIESVSRPTAN
jgi:uncharacterized protein (TIGR03435 family)